MSGPCEVYEFDESCCDLPDGTDQALIDRWQEVSTGILWRASGRRIGLCEVTVRPCLRRCFGGGFPSPYKGDDGEWRNFATCGCADDCACKALCEIVLDGPVDSIVSVLIGEDELMADNYRLDIVGGEYRLVRLNDGCWPSCSDFSAACGEEGAFCVTYMQGIAVDELAVAANSELTCNLVKSCLNMPCMLPKNVQAVSRRGVDITFDSAKGWLRTLPMVAAFLDAVNPAGLTSASTVWSPDLPSSRLTVTAEGS